MYFCKTLDKVFKFENGTFNEYVDKLHPGMIRSYHDFDIRDKNGTKIFLKSDFNLIDSGIVNQGFMGDFESLEFVNA